MAKKKAAKKKAPAKMKSAKKKPAAKKSMKSMARKSPAKKAAKKKRPKARKRELIDTGTDKRFVRRDDQGQFQDVVDVGRSLAADIRQPAQTMAPPGMGNLGD
ncbi:MAG: hypothetical protein L0211_01020 [Planctomycetaceae bacterium]|nr:hypothetical protein [Planctomycetaceae bacterium]